MKEANRMRTVWNPWRWISVWGWGWIGASLCLLLAAMVLAGWA